MRMQQSHGFGRAELLGVTCPMVLLYLTQLWMWVWGPPTMLGACHQPSSHCKAHSASLLQGHVGKGMGEGGMGMRAHLAQ